MGDTILIAEKAEPHECANTRKAPNHSARETYTMAVRTYTRHEIEVLAERLMLRGTSRIMSDQPHLQSDLRTASVLLTFMLENGMPVASCDVDVPNNGH